MRFAHLLQASGVLIACVGLAGYWLTRSEGPTPLGAAQQELVGTDADDFHVSFLIAGRDVHYGRGEVEPVYDEAGEIVCWVSSGSRSALGSNTDTIIYASLKNSDLTLVMVPRDVLVDEGRRKVNEVYGSEGADGLRRAVATTLGLPVGYHVVVNLDIFQRLVDALGGVQVDVPYRMYHRDCAAGLTIDLQPGVQRLDGVRASHFVRYRNLLRGDIDRIDNVKTLAMALVARVKELHVASVTRLPELLRSYYDEVETDADLVYLATQVLPRLGSLTVSAAGTLPTRETAGGLVADAREVEVFLASVFGGKSRGFVDAPDAAVLITNRSGVDGLEAWYAANLVRLGVPAELVRTRTAPVDGSPSRVLTTAARWDDALYYASLLRLGRQQVERFQGAAAGTGIEVSLGGDAFVAPRLIEPAPQPEAER